MKIFKLVVMLFIFFEANCFSQIISGPKVNISDVENQKIGEKSLIYPLINQNEVKKNTIPLSAARSHHELVERSRR